MIGQQIRPQEQDAPLLDVTEVAQRELGKALGAEPDQPQSIRLVFHGFG